MNSKKALLLQQTYTALTTVRDNRYYGKGEAFLSKADASNPEYLGEDIIDYCKGNMLMHVEESSVSWGYRGEYSIQ